jgi:hypothetical protein
MGEFQRSMLTGRLALLAAVGALLLMGGAITGATVLIAMGVFIGVSALVWWWSTRSTALHAPTPRAPLVAPKPARQPSVERHDGYGVIRTDFPPGVDRPRNKVEARQETRNIELVLLTEYLNEVMDGVEPEPARWSVFAARVRQHRWVAPPGWPQDKYMAIVEEQLTQHRHDFDYGRRVHRPILLD